MNISKLTYNPKWTAILIIVICLTGILLGKYVQIFRFSEHNWIYQFGSYLALFMVFSSFCWSLFHPIILFSYKKSEWRKFMIWMIVGLIPVFYFISIMIMVKLKF